MPDAGGFDEELRRDFNRHTANQNAHISDNHIRGLIAPWARFGQDPPETGSSLPDIPEDGHDYTLRGRDRVGAGGGLDPLTFWERAREVPTTPGTQSGIGRTLTVTGEGDRDFAWRAPVSAEQIDREVAKYLAANPPMQSAEDLVARERANKNYGAGFGIMTAAQRSPVAGYTYTGYSHADSNIAEVGRIIGDHFDIVGGIYTATVKTTNLQPLRFIEEGKTYFARTADDRGEAASPAPHWVIIDDTVYNVGRVINKLYYEVIGFDGFTNGQNYRIQVVFATGTHWITDRDAVHQESIDANKAALAPLTAKLPAINALEDTMILELHPGAVYGGNATDIQGAYHLAVHTPIAVENVVRAEISVQGSRVYNGAFAANTATRFQRSIQFSINQATAQNLLNNNHLVIGTTFVH